MPRVGALAHGVHFSSVDTIDVIDGRTARRQRNKDAVLDAFIELAKGSTDEPTVEAIAERAGVSYRSVYRYFDDRTDLMLSAISRVMGNVWPIFDIEQLGEGSLDDRIERFAEARIVAYHQLAPLTRLAVHRRVNEPGVGEAYDRVREYLREQLVAQFQPELVEFSGDQRQIVVAALDVMFQFEALDFLAQHDEMTDPAMAEVLGRHVRAHLAPRSIA